MKINWQYDVFDYYNETAQNVMDRMNTNAVSGHGFTIKMSTSNFEFIKKQCTNAKFMTGLPVINDVMDILVLHINKNEEPLNMD